MSNTNSSEAASDEKENSLVIYDFNPYSLPTEYLRAIGLVTAAASQTESVLQDFIGALLGIDNVQTAALTTHLSYPVKDHIIRTLAELDAPDLKELDKIDDLLDAASEAMEKRNIIVHNALMIHPDTREIFSQRLTARGTLKLELKPISVKEIEQDAASIYKAGMDIVLFMASRELSALDRTKPLRKPVNRKKKARAQRSDTQKPFKTKQMDE